MNNKGLSISAENRKKEQEILEMIFKYINKKESVIFDSGAGSGKTFSLIQSLKYIVTEYGEILKENNQRVLCITYTNVAADEISNRLGNTSLVEISTIHECVWRIISPYQSHLVEIHKKKLGEEIIKLESKLKTESWAKRYRDLSKPQQEELFNIMNSKKQLYYKHKNDKSAQFKVIFHEVAKAFPNVIKNFGNFKKIIDCIFKLQSYKITIKKIDVDNKKFKNVEYAANYNYDKLERMKISHDTLLEYAYKIIGENDILKQIVSDLYPFILIDEYQDTDCKVIEILNMIDKYSKAIGHKIFVGYFGDTKQNIYGSGVGNKILDYHKNIGIIKKKFNRRSAKVIIDVGNKIRNDGLVQETIFDNFPNGSIEFYSMDIDKDEFIEEHIRRWKITPKNKLHCLELTNEFVAKQSGFENIYEFFKKSSWYSKGKNYEYLREHILSRDTRKLGVVQSLLFKIMDFRYKIKNDETMVIDIIGKNVSKNINIFDLRNIIDKLRCIKGDTLRVYIENMFNKYNIGDEKYDACLNNLLDNEISSYSEFEDFIYNNLFSYDGHDIEYDEFVKESKNKVIEFLEMDITEFIKWYEYITDKSDSSVSYHTYHGTKGLEFDNVIIFMNSSFGRDKEYFSRLLKNITKDDKNIDEARNLLYVAVTRAILNLSILYSDDVSEFKDEIEVVFGKINYRLV